MTLRAALFVTLALCSVSAFSQDQQKSLGSVDFFGYKGLDTPAIRAAIPLREGDPFPGKRSREAWKESVTEVVTKVLGRAPTDISFVCCDQDGNYMLYIGLPGSSFAPVPFHAAPKGQERLPSTLLSSLDKAEDAFVKAVLSGHGGEDRSQGYSLMLDPDARAKQLAFRDEVLKQEDTVFRVLASSSSADQRRMAAEALGYANRSGRQIEALVDASLDPDDSVRNNAIRALGVLVDAFLEVAGQIPVEPYISLLSSGSWEDHNKASGLLASMSRTRDPRLLASLRNPRALDSLVEIARWRNPGHAYYAVMILAAIAGIEVTDPSPTQIEAIIRSAGF